MPNLEFIMLGGKVPQFEQRISQDTMKKQENIKYLKVGSESMGLKIAEAVRFLKF